MAGPYDYTVNIPQPPANNFLQSLLGIQQLKGLQQQGQLAEQQAAIQQQNAAFQQQMQPLQLEAERARIGQIGQSTAAQAEALRQGRLTFEQAQQDRVRGMEQQAIAQAQQREIVGKFTSLPPNAPMSEIVPIANQLLMLPGGEKISKQAMENFDALQQEFQKASKTALVTATTQLQAGDIEGAKKTYGTFEEAVRNSGGNNPQLKQLADGIKAQNMLLDLPNNQGVNSAKLAAVQMLSIVDPKAADTIINAEGKTTSTNAKQVDEEKRALDLEKERLQIQEIQQKLEAGRSDKVKIYASQNKEGYKLSEEARDATLQAEKARNILDKIDSGEVTLPKGLGQSIVQYARNKVPAWANDITLLQTQYQQLLAPEAKKMLPPGSASDADMREARKGLLDRNATPEQFRKSVDFFANLAESRAKYAEARLGWISENEGSIGTAVKDISVFGVPVKKGTPLNAWWNKVGKDLDLNKLPTESAPAPTYAPPADVDAILKQFGVKK